MALIDNFDSYTTGDLNGQGSWSGDVEFDVSTTSPQSGANCVENSTNATKEITKTFTAQAFGSQVFYMKRSGAGDNLRMETQILTSSTTVAKIRWDDVNNGNTATLIANGGSETVGSPSTSWVKYEVQFDGPNDRVRARADDGTWSDWVDTVAFTTVDTIKLYKEYNASGSNTYYWDSFVGQQFSEVSDTMTMTDSETVSKALVATVSDSMSMTDSETLLRIVVASVTDTIGMSESVTMNEVWANVAKNVASWTNINKS